MKDYDTLLKQIGDFGKYQKFRFYFLCVPAAFLCCYSIFLLIFVLKTPDHRCKFPEQVYIWEDGQPVSKDVLMELFIPRDYSMGVPGWSKCKMYDHSNADLTNPVVVREILSQSSSSWNKTNCQYGMWYDRSEWHSNFVTHLDLVCDRGALVSVMFSASNAGGILGMLLFSYMQDRFGRRPTFFVTIGWFVIAGLLYMAMPHWIGFAVLAFLKAFCGSACFQIPWIIALELVGPTRHTFVMIWMCVVFALACISLAGIAYLCTTWVQMVLITTLPALLLFGYWWLLDESGRWLVSTGRLTQAKKLLHKMARVNGATFDTAEIDELVPDYKMRKKSSRRLSIGPFRKQSPAPPEDPAVGEELEDDVKTYGYWTLFSTLNLALKTIIIAIIWGANIVVYSGLMLNIEHLGYNQYIVFALTSIVEIPAAFTCIACEKVGRVAFMSLSMALAGISSVLCAAVPFEITWAVILFAVLAKYFITISFDLIYLVGGELFPTMIRASGIGLSSLVASIMNIPTPFIVYAAVTIHRSIPMTVFGILSITGGFFGLFLPETTGCHLVETLEQEKKQIVGLKAFWYNVTWKFARESKKSNAPNTYEITH